MLKREIYLKQIRGFYDSDLVKILVGMRRCGKSVVLKQIIEELKSKGVEEDRIIDINFEFVEFNELKDINKLNSYIKNKITSKKMYYIFFDEIGYVNDFEVVVNSLRASLDNVSIFITGSNSKLLSNELSTVLSGRYVSFNIYPLSYKEYISLTKKDGYDISNFYTYLKWGGLPNLTEFSDTTEMKNYLNSVFDSIILRDVIDRLGLKDITLFSQILEYLIDTTGKEFSLNNILEYFKKNNRDVSSKTLYSYLDALTKALIIKKIYRYDIHGKALLKTLNKYYVTDLGIAHNRTNSFEINETMALENVVLNELQVRGYNVFIAKTKKGEIDFLGIKDNEKYYYQVSYSIENEKTLQREISAFDEITEGNKYLITLDETKEFNNNIIHKNLIDWLMDGE